MVQIMPKLMNSVLPMGIINEDILPPFQCFDVGGIHWRADHFGSGFLGKVVLSLKASEGYCPWSNLWELLNDCFRKQLGER